MSLGLHDDLASVRVFPECFIIDLHPRSIDAAIGSSLGQELSRLARATSIRTIYLNCWNVRAVSLDFWIHVLALDCELRGAGRRLCLVNLTSELTRQMHAVKLAEDADTQEMAALT